MAIEKKPFRVHVHESSFERTVRVLNVINPHGYTVDGIKRTAYKAFLEPSLIGTAGWYVFSFLSPHPIQDVLYVEAYLMPYTVENYLIREGKLEPRS